MRDDDTELPVRRVQAWTDGKGNLHPTKEAALLVEIERVLGHFGSGESLAPGIARMIVAKRDKLVPLLDAFDTEPEAIEAIALDTVLDSQTEK